MAGGGGCRHRGARPDLSSVSDEAASHDEEPLYHGCFRLFGWGCWSRNGGVKLYVHPSQHPGLPLRSLCCLGGGRRNAWFGRFHLGFVALPAKHMAVCEPAHSPPRWASHIEAAAESMTRAKRQR